MPCYGWSIPASDCITGSKLRNVKDSVCSGCYAMRGNYNYPNVKKALATRLEQSADLKQWVNDIIISIQYTNETNYFRWFDSGDLQSTAMLEAIASVAYNLPQIKFWLPTREVDFLKEYFKRGNKKPANLTIRLSDNIIDKPRKLLKSLDKQGILQSGVSRDKDNVNCASFEQHGKCLACRACWDNDIKITYLKH